MPSAPDDLLSGQTVKPDSILKAGVLWLSTVKTRVTRSLRLLQVT